MGGSHELASDLNKLISDMKMNQEKYEFSRADAKNVAEILELLSHVVLICLDEWLAKQFPVLLTHSHQYRTYEPLLNTSDADDATYLDLFA